MVEIRLCLRQTVERYGHANNDPPTRHTICHLAFYKAELWRISLVAGTIVAAFDSYHQVAQIKTLGFDFLLIEKRVGQQLCAERFRIISIVPLSGVADMKQSELVQTRQRLLYMKC